MTAPDPRREAVAKAIRLEYQKSERIDYAFDDIWCAYADAALAAIPPGDAEKMREDAARLINQETNAWEEDDIPSWIFKRLSASIRALPVTPRPMARDGWQPIEIAPRVPYAPIDLWVVPGAPLVGTTRQPPYREANARISGNGKYWLTDKGNYIEGRVYFDDEGERCRDLDDRSGDVTRVTHWMPLPGVPDPMLDLLNRAEVDAEPSTAKTEDDWAEAALNAWRDSRDQPWTSIEDDMHAAVQAADLARFGGDPAEQIAELQGDLYAEKARYRQVFTETALPKIEQQNARIAQLEREGSELSANQCHHGYASEFGHHRCKYQDEISMVKMLRLDAITEPEAQIAKSDTYRNAAAAREIALRKRIDELEVENKDLHSALFPFSYIAQLHQNLPAAAQVMVHISTHETLAPPSSRRGAAENDHQ